MHDLDKQRSASSTLHRTSQQNYLHDGTCSYTCTFLLILAAFFRSARSCRGFFLHGASPRCKSETTDSIIRSDGKSLCKVFCIITYQSQNSHPQILWVTKHRQLPHYCPPKSIPSDDKEPGERRGEERREKKKQSSNLILED
ncbi:hypothetical protein CHARACLAT_032326 [Characodon lateralis]|uniref:Uncharacterized protein n=1 Tax=Characodon lateralis TaxID=208331 RepID=A0ABU7FAZ3_9TELE|nr:hypothetical protein [Characodon lateralis]